ncbi:MAG: thioredoxin fold domain-containing protein [Kiritimatiellae bacterium]|nr:thioredoxin fold domain-containing protein [Kiritimatiellia bacterium]
MLGCAKKDEAQEKVAKPPAENAVAGAEADRQSEKTGPIAVNNAEDFEAHVLKARLPCLADFFSLRCPPCRMLAPTIEKLAGQYKGRAVVCKVSLDHPETQVLSERYGIRAIPTVILFVDGKEVKRMIGLRSENEYAAVLDESLQKADAGTARHE